MSLLERLWEFLLEAVRDPVLQGIAILVGFAVFIYNNRRRVSIWVGQLPSKVWSFVIWLVRQRAVVQIPVVLFATVGILASCAIANTIGKRLTDVATQPDWMNLVNVNARATDTCGKTILSNDPINPAQAAPKLYSEISEEIDRNPPMTIVHGDNEYAFASLDLDITSISNSSADIQLSNIATIDIQVQLENIPDNADIVSYSSGGCAGENPRHTNLIMLDSRSSSYSVERQFSEFGYYTLRKGAIEKFEFRFQCSSPGRYTFNISIPYFQADRSGSIEYTPPQAVLCPRNASYWIVPFEQQQFILEKEVTR